jgi:hypothetical protein
MSASCLVVMTTGMTQACQSQLDYASYVSSLMKGHRWPDFFSTNKQMPGHDGRTCISTKPSRPHYERMIALLL